EKEEIDLLIIGHMDTVFSKGTAVQRPFRMDEEKAYGPGTADMKSGDLLAIALVENLLKDGTSLSICFANNCDEEIGSVSSNDWIEKLGKQSRYCLDFEPGRADGSFVKTRKGVQKVVVKMNGISSHAGVNPDSGASAILEMSNWICHFEQFRKTMSGARANFDVIKGGVVYNMIPGYAECEVDIRFDTRADLDEIMDEFKRLQENPFDERVKVVIEREGYTPPMVTNENSLKLMAMMDEEGHNLGQEVKFVGTGGGSDASRVSSAGAATIDCCGPVGMNAHNENEYILLSTIEERLQLLYNVCRKLTV
ncbi:MAG: M20/M25/M40 family metallo-hydrolase, partial [Firmicutes bacterium]|nr:M20/M25/M40 family metallo-hydrolase [Bacillota bacterium]